MRNVELYSSVMSFLDDVCPSEYKHVARAAPMQTSQFKRNRLRNKTNSNFYP